MNARLKILAVVVLTALAGSASATSPDTFAVSAKLTHGDHAFAEPSAVVLAGTPATLEVSGADGYKLTLTVSEISADEIQVAADLESSHGSMAPTLVVRPGQVASVSVGELGLELTVTEVTDK